MPSNVEIKARVRDFAALNARARQLTEKPVQVIPQLDTFFVTATGRLKLRELDSGVAQLIYYERPDQDGPKRSDYSIFETRDPSALRSVLEKALGIRGKVEKVRHLYLVGQTRVHLDEVKGLGHFLELEVVLQPGQSDREGHLIAEELISQLGIERRDLLESAYMDLLEQSD
ncbi:MAG: class IV adenylate cyclase [Chloroflexota bacterium]